MNDHRIDHAALAEGECVSQALSPGVSVAAGVAANALITLLVCMGAEDNAGIVFDLAHGCVGHFEVGIAWISILT